ncbi:MAG: hypothetical protein EGP96_21055 [Roseburia inulinivorans]|nr:hypothetical protein [Roseburia inulinivorans]
MSNAGYLGYSVEDAVAYSRYTVNKADLTTANLTKVVNKTTLDSTDTFDGTSTVNDKLGTSVDASFASFASCLQPARTNDTIMSPNMMFFFI